MIQMSRSMSHRYRQNRNNRNHLTSKLPPIHLNVLVPRRDDEITDWNSSQSSSKSFRHFDNCYEGGPLKLRGFLYNPTTKKYFKMTAENCGISGFSRFDQERREKARAAKIAANRPRFTSASFIQRPVVQPITRLLDDREVGRGALPRIHRHFDEMKLLNCPDKPTFSMRTPIEEDGLCSGCEFLEVSESGDRIVGGFAIRSYDNTTRRYSSLYTFEAYSISELVQESREKKEKEEGTHNNASYNTIGLLVNPINGSYYQEEGAQVFDDFTYKFEDVIVDQTLAQIDRDVTCCLTVTAADKFIPSTGGITSRCTVHLTPVQEFCNPECAASLSSPIYTRRWQDRENIWSVGWNAQKMSIGFGMEDCFRMENLLSNHGFIMSSRKKNVISHCFSADGSLVMMGLRADDVIRSDLRMNRDHITGHFKGSKSSGFVKVLKNAHPDCMLTESFDGKIRLWDQRRTDRPIMILHGHQNSHYRVPCKVDVNEKFVFAVGSDGITRGWSLMTGDLLCNVKSPRPETGQQSMFPQIMYSDNLGGQVGNSCLVIAVGDTLRFHVLDF